MRWNRIISVLGFLGVALGAFAAHALKNRIEPSMLESFRTGVLYHLIHTVALLAIYPNIKVGGKALLWTARFFLIGIVLFSGSLYCMALSGWKLWGIVTPFGGLCFLIAWLCLGFQSFPRKPA